MPFNDGFSTESIPYVSPEISGTVLVADGNEWVAAIVSSGGGGGISAVSSSGNITGSGLSGNEIRLKDNISLTSITASNILVNGTASINLLNVVNRNELQIGDKYITILSGAADHVSLDGSGILWGSGSTGPTVGDRGENAHIVYRASNDVLEIFPGLSASVVSSSVLTSSNLYVSNNISASSLTSSNVNISYLTINNNLSASTVTGSFSGSFLGVNQVIAGTNLSSSTAGALQTLALSSSVVGLNNLQSNRISGSSITASSLVVVDENTNDDLYLSVLQNYNYPFALMTKRLEFGVSWFSYVKASGSLADNYLFPTNFYTEYLNTSNIDFAAGLSNTQNVYNIGNINTLINTDIYNVISGNIGTVNSSSILRISDFFTDSNQTRRNNVINNYGILLYPLEVGVTRYPLYLKNALDASREVVINNSGNLGLGTTNTTEKLNINGNVLLTGSLTITTGSVVTKNPKISINAGSSSIADTYSINNRTSRYTAMVETTTGDYHVQSVDLLVANNGSAALITPYALVSTNGAYIASFDVAINGSSVELTATNLSGENIVVTLSKNYII